MRAVFMGTPEAAVPSLRALAAAHEVAEVYTRPDKARGRGRRPQPSPVKAAALEIGVGVHEPRTLRDPAEHERLRSLAADIVVVAAFGYILPPEVLETPKLGCVNVHFSLLPRWRGAAPVQRAILAGDTETGVTIMLMDEGLDTGPVLATQPDAINPDDTSGTVTARLATIGAALLVPTIESLAAGALTPQPQPDDGVTYAGKIDPAEAALDPAEPAEALARKVRAFNPAPGAWLPFRGQRLKVWSAQALDGEGAAGTIADPDGPDVQTSSGRLRLIDVQPEGKRSMPGDAFARGYRPERGERLQQ